MPGANRMVAMRGMRVYDRKRKHDYFTRISCQLAQLRKNKFKVNQGRQT